MRYIDADALIKKLFPYDVVDKKDYTINAKAVADAIANTPTADVVPKSEVEELIRENESLAKTVNEASELIRKLRSKVKKSKSDVAREIFEEIAQISCRISECDGNGNIRILCYQLSSEKLAELKKKYTEEQNDT